MFNSLSSIPNLRSKRILLRLDLNVPIQNGEIQDDYRIKRSQKTLDFLKNAGARTVIVAHIDKKEGASLAPVYEYLKKSIPVSFSNLADAPQREISDGEFLLIENLRNDPREEANDEGFARELSALADVYINEAFSVSHRAHASIVGVPKFLPSYAGFLFEEEVRHLSESFNPPRPFLFILGGAKFETKMPLVEKFLKLADYCFIGGALANDFFKAKGFETGTSLVSKEKLDLKDFLENQKLSFPHDVLVSNDGASTVKKSEGVGKNDLIVDAGPETLKELEKLISQSAFIVWNGPLGNYEKGFSKGTEELAKLIASSRSRSVLGGGDTLAVVMKLGLLEKFSFVSTGGGAMLEFLANETLVGIKALEESAKLRNK